MKITRRGMVLGSALAAAVRPDAVGKTGPLPGRRFAGEALREIAFPLGGIGTGTVSLSGCGHLCDWEIFNRPNQNTHLPFTFAALRLAGQSLPKPAAFVLERELPAPYGHSHGIGRELAAGLPRFRDAVFTGAYPFAGLELRDSRWPVEVDVEAFNPFVPLDTAASSLPVAVLTYSVRSLATLPLDASLAFSLPNPIGYDPALKPVSRRAKCFGGNVNQFRRAGGAAGILMRSEKSAVPPPRRGTLALVTGSSDVSYRLAWEHGALWDELPAWWRDFTAGARFPGGESKPSDEGFTEYATLAAHFTLAPGATRRVTFVIGWHFPTIEDYWTGKKPYFISQQVSPTRLMRNQYGTEWPSAWEPAAHVLANLDSLRQRSAAYRDTLYASTLPPEVLDAVSSQVSTLRTNTVMVEEGRRVLAFEGCADDEGSCPMNCTHVFNYAQSMAHLFPDLERGIREIDFEWNLREDGYMSFRTATPVQRGAYTKIPAADGQMGSILKLYREWQLSGDDGWLRRLWPAAKKALEFAWQKWDADRDGVMEGEQHNTYDVRFHGPNSMVGTLYLGALAAASRMARRLGDADAAARYQTLFQAGSRRLDEMLWNGSYYVQKTDPGKSWQFGSGCLSDQLLGQWFSEMVGLGDLLPRAHIRSALESVDRHNFRDSFRDSPSAQRIYALNDEQGLVVCSWPDGKRPAVPFGYSEEVWTGVEYQVAAHLIFKGMVKEGVRLVKAVRDRHDGRRRNPWDETEAGSHYARAMSSWSLLHAFSGFQWSAPENALRFRPVTGAQDFRCLFAAGQAWGGYEQTAGPGLDIRIRVSGGSFSVGTLRVPAVGACTVQGAAAECRREGDLAVVQFRERKVLRAGDELSLRIS